MINLLFAAIISIPGVCDRIREVQPGQFLYKAEISAHINPIDYRSTGPTLVCGKICAESFPVQLFYSDGKKAARLGYYGTYAGNGKPRAYCGCCGVPRCYNDRLQSRSLQRGRDGYLYLRLKPSRRVCWRVNVGGRTGSL
jgi:hypothetical protein